MEFLTCLTTIYESSNSIKFLTSISNAFLSPCRSASYLVVLLLHSNYNQQVIKVLLPVGFMSTQPTPTPSLDFEQSKYKDQICASSVVLGILGKVRVWVWVITSDCCPGSMIEEILVMKLPKKVFILYVSNEFVDVTKGPFVSFRSVTVCLS